jgi:hypothetical protein
VKNCPKKDISNGVKRNKKRKKIIRTLLTHRKYNALGSKSSKHPTKTVGQKSQLQTKNYK